MRSCIICGRPTLTGIPFCAECSVVDQIGSQSYFKSTKPSSKSPYGHNDPAIRKVESGAPLSSITAKELETHNQMNYLNFIMRRDIPLEVREIAISIPYQEFDKWHEWYFIGRGYLKTQETPYSLEVMGYIRHLMLQPTSFTVKSSFVYGTRRKIALEIWDKVNDFIKKYSSMSIEYASDNIIKTHFPDDSQIDFGYYINKNDTFSAINISIYCFTSQINLQEIANINEHLLAYYITSGKIYEKFINLALEEGRDLMKVAFPWRGSEWHKNLVAERDKNQREDIDNLLNTEKLKEQMAKRINQWTIGILIIIVIIVLILAIFSKGS